MARLIDADALILALSGGEEFKSMAESMHDARFIEELRKAPTVAAVPVEQYKSLLEMYNELRENFVDYVCSGVPNPAPYCLNKCEGCVDRHGWCKQDSDKCQGFNPAECII